jgi:hypothetical protein
MVNASAEKTAGSKTHGSVTPGARFTPVDLRVRAALRLHEHLVSSHWNGHALTGPDVGIRFNSRIGRFIKSYLSRVRWKDDYYYIQAQGYWILANWQLYSLVRENRYRDIAIECSEFLLARQPEDGAWLYPNPEWRGRIATAEGTWGSLGLLESYRRTRDRKFLAGVAKWHGYLVWEIGFQKVGEELAVNYFYGKTGPRVPNNSAIVLRFLAELAEAADDDSYLQPCSGLLNFLRAVQENTGEFPYTVRGENGGKVWPHFQCFQYNAFQCLDLMSYLDLSGDERVLPLIRRLLGFLRGGLDENGRSYFECGNRHREVTYHTAVLAQAFARARHYEIPGYDALADRAYDYLLKLQRPDGSFGFSRGDYYLFSDRRSYPRNLAMILLHLLSVTPKLAHHTAPQPGYGPPAFLQ